ncbi:hypothetical protein BKA70DRAFT_1446691 [Coprinopsis sp. MPI-PUGE-AT-0042]|nr:hypothetical protein BKA70DRAFT_1446691 [Coprinopsis sp. MPI-PUGE-AT-0042]
MILIHSQHLTLSQSSNEDASQVGGGVSTRSSARKALALARPGTPPTPSAGLQRSISKAQHALAGDSASSHIRRVLPMPQFPDLRLPHPPQPKLSGDSETPQNPPEFNGSNNDNDDDFFRSDRTPLSQPRLAHYSLVTPQAHPPADATLNDGSLARLHASSEHASGDDPLHSHRDITDGKGKARALPAVPEEEDDPLIPSFFPLLAAKIPKGFNTLAAQAPAQDEVEGSRCDFSFDGDEEEFDTSPSPKSTTFFLRMHKATGRTVSNLRNHYLASKGLKRATRSIWNKYQWYFAANRVQERAACGNENAECKEVFLHFQTRFANWREILSQVDEILTQEEACASGYRRRTAFNQAIQTLKTLARINDQTHGFQTFTIIMGNQPNTDQNLFSIIESPGAQGFIGEKEDNRPCAMFTSDFIGSYRAHVNTMANNTHIANFHAHQVEAAQSQSQGLSTVLALHPTQTEQQPENKQMKLAAPKPHARSASVVSTSSTSDGNDTALRNTIRDFFHTKLKLVNVTISPSSFPWKQLDRTLVSQGGVILNYPNDVPFPNVSSDPTYNGPPCKAEGGRNGTGIRKIGIAAMRWLASRCHDGDDGLRFIGGYSKHLIKTSKVPGIIGPVPSDASGTIRCLYYDGSAKWVPHQVLPAEWVTNIKHESPPTPKASKGPIQVVPNHDLSPSPSRSSTTTPGCAKGTACLSPLPPPISTQFSMPPPRNQGAALPSPTPRATKQPVSFPMPTPPPALPSPTPRAAEQPVSFPTPTPPPADHPTLSSKPTNPLANLHSHPRARIAGPRPTSSTTIGPSSVGSQEAPLMHGVVENSTKASPIQSSKPATSKRVLEDRETDTPSSKRLKSRSPDPSHMEGGRARALPTIPAVLGPSSGHPHSRQPALPLEAGSSPPILTPVLKEQAPDAIKPRGGLDSTAIPVNVNNPTVPPDVSHTPDHSGLQVPPSMHQSSYAQPTWQSGYGSYPPYGHPSYYPPPPPQWGYPDGRPNYYQQEAQRDSQGTAPSTMHSPPPGVS